MLSNEGITTLPEGPGLPRELQPDFFPGSSRGPSWQEEDVIDYSWQKDAACKSMDTNLFFLGQGRKISQEVIDVCAGCPVKKACLDHALLREEYGYWAGTNSATRTRMRKELGIKLKPINYEMLERQDIAAREAREAFEPKIKGRGRKPAACGTRSGYNAHLRRRKKDPNEVPCDACKHAQVEAIVSFKKSKKDLHNLNNIQYDVATLSSMTGEINE